MNLFHYLILLNSLFFCVFIFFNSKLLFTFLSAQTSSVKSKHSFMISAKNQAKWYIRLWDLVPFWDFNFLKYVVVVVFLRELRRRRRSWPPSFLIDRGSHTLLPYMLLLLYLHFQIYTPLFPFKILSLSFYCTFLYLFYLFSFCFALVNLFPRIFFFL